MRRAAILAVLVGFLSTGCMGHFALTGSVKNFNLNLGRDKWGREVVFLALFIIPVYPVCAVVDAVFMNTIEFWTDENPVNGETAITLAEAGGDPGQASEARVAVNAGGPAAGGEEDSPERAAAGGQ